MGRTQGLAWRALILGTVLTGACGGDVEEKTVVTFWRHDNASYRKADDDAFAAYTKDHAGIEIQATTVDWWTYTMALNADLTRNQFGFDLVLLPPSVVCSYAANLADVPEEVVTVSEAQNTFFPQPLAGSTCAGKLKALPVEYNLEYGGVIVNLDKWEAKFPTRAPGWETWDAFLADAAALSEFDPSGKPCTNGLDIDPDWPEPARHLLLSQILQRGGHYWSTTGDPGLFDFDTPAARESLTTMVDWMTRFRVMSPALVPTKNTFVTVRLAKGATDFGCSDDLTKPLSIMGYAGTWAVPDIRSQLPPDSKMRFEFFRLPPMVGTEHKFVQNSGFAFAVPLTSQHPKLAWDIAKSIALSPAAMKAWAATAGTLPALRANGTPEAAATDPVLAKVQPLLEHGQWMGYIPAASTEAVLGAMVTNFFDAVKGMKTVEQALRDMQETANAAIIQHR
jgi:multiple sugar transport system substrate-binding protein